MLHYFSIFLFVNTIIFSGTSFANTSNNNNSSAIQSKVTAAETSALAQLQQRLPSPPKEDSNQNISNANTATPAIAQTNQTPQNNAPAAPAPTASSQNPWLKSNPWATQAKQNPWANQQPSNSGTNSSYSNTNTLPPPPNIFSQSQIHNSVATPQTPSTSSNQK